MNKERLEAIKFVDMCAVKVGQRVAALEAECDRTHKFLVRTYDWLVMRQLHQQREVLRYVRTLTEVVRHPSRTERELSGDIQRASDYASGKVKI